MAEVIAAAAEGQPGARLAVGLYVHRLRAGIASMASAMDGLDVLAFTGGVGENAGVIRAEAGAGLGFLGVQIDGPANDSVVPDADVSAPGARVRTVVLGAREDKQIATEVRALLGTMVQ